MRIIKYLFLLLMLSLVTLAIFIATQKGEFSVEKSKIINAERAAVFNYTNDYKNWKEWNSFADNDSSIDFVYSNYTAGSGSFCRWEGINGIGELKTIRTTKNESIIQTMHFNGNTADIVLSFSDTLGKTKVKWAAKGRMSFLLKVKTIFEGGTNKIFGNSIEKSLTNLDGRLDYEMNTHNIKFNGVVKKLEAFYLSQTLTNKFSNIDKNSEIVFSKIITFCKNNNVAVSGKPFVIFHTYDTTSKLTKMSICIPIKEPIFISDGSEIASDTLKSFEAVKVTLRGDYQHKNKVLSKSSDYFKKHNLKSDALFSRLELYSIGKNEINNPSKWKTEIYFPIKPKLVYKTPSIKSIVKEEVVSKTTEAIPVPDEF